MIHFSPKSGPTSSPRPAPVLLQDARGVVEVPRGGGAKAPQLPEGLAHGAGVLGQTLDVLEGHVDYLVAAGAAEQVTAGEAFEAHLVGDTALAVGQVGPQGQRPRQGAAVQAAGLTRAHLRWRPGGGTGQRVSHGNKQSSG